MPSLYPEARCPHCSQVKPLSAFYDTPRSGRSSWCKECIRAQRRAERGVQCGWTDAERDAHYAAWCARRDDRALLALQGMARCPVCGEAKPQGEFYPDRRRKTGFEHRCKSCTRAKAQRYHWDPATPRKGQGQLCLFPLDKRCPRCRHTKPLYEFSHWAKGRFGHRAYCAACECALVLAYTAAHPERKPHRNAAKRVKYHSNPAYRSEVLRRRKMWYQANVAKSQAAQLRWKATHYEQYQHIQRTHKLKRRTIMARIEGQHTLADLRLIRAAQRDKCAYCQRPLGSRYHVDHMTAVTRGGSDWPWNLCLTCPRCNCRKQAMSAGWFLALLIKESRHDRKASLGTSRSGLPRPRRPATQ